MTTIREFDDAARRVVEGIDDLLTIGAQASKHLERRGLLEQARLVREEIIAVASGEVRVPVVGEFKSGKSTFLNALLGSNVVCADPVRSTSVPIEIRFADEPTYHADLVEGRDVARIEVDVETFRALALAPNPVLDGRSLQALRAGVPSPLLASGLRLVDTPSVSGGLASAAASTVVAELLQSHVWIVTTDASQELTGPELELIKIGTSLCPIVIVVATRCDMAPHWRRIVELDRQHLAELDLPLAPVVIPIASPLRAAAIRLADPGLDQESGLPLVTWFLTRSATAMARLTSVRAAAGSVADEMESLDRVLTDEIDTLLNSGERARILAASEQARGRCERLATTARPALDRAINEFRKRTRRDLEDRIEEVRRQLLDDLATLVDRAEWPRIERRAQADVNRLLAAHLAELMVELRRIVESMSTELGLESGELRVLDRMVVSDQAPDGLVGHLDPPSLSSSPASSRLHSVLLPARVGITGSSGVGVGISSGILSGAMAVVGVALVPIAIIGSGWWLRQRERAQRSVPWKQQAAIELNRFLTDCHQLIGRCSEDMRDEVIGQLPRLAEACFARKARDLATEFERLTALAADRANVHHDRGRQLDEQRSDARVVATHARRLIHRLHTPSLDVSMPGTVAASDQSDAAASS